MAVDHDPFRPIRPEGINVMVITYLARDRTENRYLFLLITRSKRISLAEICAISRFAASPAVQSVVFVAICHSSSRLLRRISDRQSLYANQPLFSGLFRIATVSPHAAVVDGFNHHCAFSTSLRFRALYNCARVDQSSWWQQGGSGWGLPLVRVCGHHGG